MSAIWSKAKLLKDWAENYSELKEGLWPEPAKNSMPVKANEECTQKHEHVAFVGSR